MKAKLPFVFAFLAINCTSESLYAQETRFLENPNGENPIINKEHRFTMDFPRGWTIKAGTQKDTLVKAVFKDDLGRIAMITISAYFVPENDDTEGESLTVEDLWEGIRSSAPDFTFRMIDSGVSKVRSRRSVWIFHEVTDPPQAKVVSKQHFVVRGSYLYSISLISDSGSDFLREMLPTMEKSVQTLAFY